MQEKMIQYFSLAVSIYVLLDNGYPGKVGSAQILLDQVLRQPTGNYIEETSVIVPESGQDIEEQCRVPSVLACSTPIENKSNAKIYCFINSPFFMFLLS